MQALPNPVLEPLFRAEITLAPIRDLGRTPLGHRRIIEITGGSFSGKRLSGRVLPGGADWQVIRPDTSAYLDTRYTLETEDGALIYVQNKGYRHGSPEVLARLAKGEPVDPASYYMRTAPWFETSAEKYAWINRTICIGVGARLAAGVCIDFYTVE